jgi:hypothetical protein
LDTKSEFEIAQELAAAAETVPPLDNQQARTLMFSVQGESKSLGFVHSRIRNPEKEHNERWQ